ncbi:hypothetical protein [Dactylosporangium sp. NPDC048998]|uniref:hypothetical protein n=1 Tax=Dactylosporangium sp. NPDC048998 TaxID=3363976 RepID=UPI0037217C57
MDLYDEIDCVTDRRRPGWRARIVIDDDASEPGGDALAPALLTGRDGHARIAAAVYQDEHAEEILHAWRHFSDRDQFIRYLRLVHGTTALATAAGGDTTVLIFDTSGYRAHAGITGTVDLTAERDEWQAWLDGDVYGVIVERATQWPPCVHCGRAVPAGWVHADACWGFYGHTYATEQALHLLRAAARH